MNMNEAEGQKRRLPPWMIGVAVESESKEVNEIIIDEEKVAGSPSRQKKSRARRAKKLENETLISHNSDCSVDGSSLLVQCESKKARSKVMNKEVKSGNNILEATKKLEVGDSSLLVKCERRRRKRKIGIQEEDNCDGEVGRKNKEPTVKRRRKVKRSFESSNDEIEDASSDEDEGELTMEDLLSIAKEFVSNDNNVAEKQPSDEEKHVVQSKVPEITARVTKNKETDSCNNSAKNSTFGAVEHTRMTGDPAQDMLDLFLGPLLKDKPIENENKNKVGLITAHMRSDFESNKQEQKGTKIQAHQVQLSPFESSNEEIEDASSNEDEGELTMEDLLSIAKEFVSNDNNVAEKQPSDEEKRVVQSKVTEITARVTKNKETDSCYNSAKNTTFGAVEHTRMTGDPAQDMLDLFLGPLLKDKPLENENKNKVGLITAHMRLDFESNKQEQKDICGGQPVVPVTKKKTSLRDQVSAFLD